MIAPAARPDAGAFLVRLLRLDPHAVVRLRPGRPTDGGTELWAMLPFGVLATRRLRTLIEADITLDAADLLAALDPEVSTLDKVARRDADWRWPLPSSRGIAIESIPAAEIVRIAAAAARTLREAAEQGVAGRAVPERALRDALLDHVPIVVTRSPAGTGDPAAGGTGDPAARGTGSGSADAGAVGGPDAASGSGSGAGEETVRVPQRVVQAVVRMGFLGSVAGSERPPAGDPGGPVERSESVTFGDNFVTVRRAAGWIGVDASYGSVWYRPTSPLRLS